MKRYNLILLLTFSLCSFLITTGLAADDFKFWNSARDYEPIILKGSDLTEFLGNSVADIFAYAYIDRWIQIPLQIDERDNGTHVWLSSPNLLLDANDVIIFMARDMGEKVSDPGNWIDDVDSRNYVRIEITAFDPKDLDKEGYIYFYFSATLQDTCDINYMNYIAASPGTASDRIEAKSYVQAHNDAGILDYWEIPVSAGGNGEDLLDRHKTRITAFSAIAHELTEDGLQEPVIKVVTGKIRVARRIKFTIYDEDVEIDTVRLSTYYYPYSIDAQGASEIFDPIYKVTQVRQSFDLTNKASSMKFYNNFNSDITVDGMADAVKNNIVSIADSSNWFLCTGDQGTILTLMKIEPLDTVRLYYFDDNSSGAAGDGKAETGDGQSWGDAGILIKSAIGKTLDIGFNLPFTTYFLSKSQATSIGSEYAKNSKHPLVISINSAPVPVELISFQAEVSRGDVVLSWSTASESDNYGFEIQRRNEHDTNWNHIGFVEGNGTSSVPRQYSFVDHRLSPNTYFYRLKQIDLTGNFIFSQPIEVTVAAPQIFSLEQNYPNPFNPGTTINYQIPEKEVNVHLTIYNLLGGKVRTLISKNKTAGYHTVYWDGKDDNGNIAPTGIYIYRLRAGDFVATRRMVLMK